MTTASAAPIWNDIRPYLDGEVHQAVVQLLADPEFDTLLPKVMPEHASAIKKAMLQANSIAEIKVAFGYNAVQYVLSKSSFSSDLSGTSRLGGDVPATFISNHRDIILDSALLGYLMYNKGYRMPRIAIGDNLFARPWIKELVRLMDSVTVKRSGGPRDLLLGAQALSGYIHHSIQEDKASLWIAQREGRAKDGNDKTQPALLKMLAIEGEGSVVDRLVAINLVPMSISYEYDPCDYLKAQELFVKSLQGSYTKQSGEDLLNMKEGLVGKKGRIHITLGTPLSQLLQGLQIPSGSKEQLNFVANLIDQEIYRHYRLYPGNYVADDLLNQSLYNQQAGHYSEAEKDTFITYIEGQLNKCQTPLVAREVIRKTILQMYAYPLRNHLATVTN